MITGQIRRAVLLLMAAIAPLTAFAVDPQTAANYRAQAFKTLTPVGAPTPGNIFAALGFGPKPGEVIMLAGDHPFLGDSLLAWLGKVEALHRLFPENKIRLLHNFADRMVAKRWFEPVLIHDARSAEVDDAIHPGVFVIALQDQLSASTLKRKGARGLIIKKQQTLSSELEFILVAEGEALTTGKAIAGDPDVRYVHLDASTSASTQTNLYESYDLQTRLLFGDANGLAWPPELFADPARETAADAFLEETFVDGAHAEFAVLNQNTKNSPKVYQLRSRYTARIKSWIDQALQGAPRLKILITPPEDSFGHETAEQVTELVRGYGERVAFLPEDRRDWANLIRRAKYVVTQDSGFNWASLTVLPPDRVLTSFTSEGLADWRMPGQPFTIWSLTDDDHPDRALLDWIRAQNQSLECSRQIRAQNNTQSTTKD